MWEVIELVYTSRYANPELKSENYTAIRISIGAPRWKIGYTLAGAIKDLMPIGLRHIENPEEFCCLYYERLDSIGVDNIRNQIQYYESLGKPVVLLCFEDIRKGGNNWCHRSAFAKWWQKRTGEIIPELKDDSAFKVEGAFVVLPEVPSKENTAISDSEDKVLINVVYSTWEDDGGDMFYTIDKDNNKHCRIADTKALDLISRGKAELSVDYDSIPKIRFLLTKDSRNRVFKNRKGKETEITFEEARRLLLDGKAGIEDIELEK